MTTATYAGLRLTARAGGLKPDDMETEDNAEGEDEAENGKKPKGKKKDEYMTESEANAAIAAARAEGFAEATARANTVLASEHYAGREALATTLLANDKLSADEIVTALAAAGVNSGGVDDEERQRAAMRHELAVHQPPNTGADVDEPEAEANYGWDEIHAEVAKDRQL